jgi:hypothetical protein
MSWCLGVARTGHQGATTATCNPTLNRVIDFLVSSNCCLAFKQTSSIFTDTQPRDPLFCPSSCHVPDASRPRRAVCNILAPRVVTKILNRSRPLCGLPTSHPSSYDAHSLVLLHTPSHCFSNARHLPYQGSPGPKVQTAAQSQVSEFGSKSLWPLRGRKATLLTIRPRPHVQSFLCTANTRMGTMTMDDCLARP